MTATGPERAAAMLAALEKLPRHRGVVFRGLPIGVVPPNATIVTQLLTATSRDARTAAENFTHPGLAAIVSRAGRDVSALAADPSAAEVVLLPGSMLVPVHRLRLETPTMDLYLLEQVDPSDRDGRDMSGLPPTLDALIEFATTRIVAALARSSASVTSPGRFAGPIE